MNTVISTDQSIIQEFNDYISDQSFPCIGAKAALAKNSLSVMVAGHMACPFHDLSIFNFLCGFTENYHKNSDKLNGAVIIFKEPITITEIEFENFMWSRLQSIADLDAAKYKYDKRVDRNPISEKFSFSIKEEGYFIIGMHPGSSRKARQFGYPALVFNPHAQFEALKEKGKYSYMQKAIREKDKKHSGSINPMLSDFGNSSEVLQYSGKNYTNGLTCPLKFKHEL